MASEWTPRERLLAAIECQEPDRVPVTVRSVLSFQHLWSTPEERLKVLLDMGVDDILNVYPPTAPHPETEITHWLEEGNPYPILHKKVETPVGTLSSSIQKTEDLPTDYVPVHSDWLWSRGVDFPVKSYDDLPALDYLLPDPSELDLTEFREMAKHARKVANEYSTLLQGYTSGAPIVTMSLLGPKRMMYLMVDNPDLVKTTLEKVSRWSNKVVSLLIDAGVDIIYRSGCYESIDFFSPSHVREFFMPSLEQQVSLCHESNVLFHHFLETGGMPFLEDYARIGIDVFSALDDHGANPMNLEECKKVLGGKVCLWGGVDPREPFERGTPEDVQEEVLRVLRILAPGGGYVLGTTGSFFHEANQENVRAYIDFGRNHGKYPFALS